MRRALRRRGARGMARCRGQTSLPRCRGRLRRCTGRCGRWTGTRRSSKPYLTSMLSGRLWGWQRLRQGTASCASRRGRRGASERWRFSRRRRRCSTYTLMPLTDVPYALVSWGALVFTLRFAKTGGAANAVAAAILLALAPLTRVAGAVLVVAACVWVALDARRRGRAWWAMRSMVAAPAIATSAVAGLWILSPGDGGFDYAYDLLARDVSTVPREVAPTWRNCRTRSWGR